MIELEEIGGGGGRVMGGFGCVGEEEELEAAGAVAAAPAAAADVVPVEPVAVVDADDLPHLAPPTASAQRQRG